MVRVVYVAIAVLIVVVGAAVGALIVSGGRAQARPKLASEASLAPIAPLAAPPTRPKPASAVSTVETPGALDPALPVESAIPLAQADPAVYTEHPFFKRTLTTSSGIIYGVSDDEGIFVSLDGGSTWHRRNAGLPIRVVYPFTGDKIEVITAIGVDPDDGSRIAAATPSRVFLSEDAGATWTQIPVHDPVKPAAFITAVALSPFDKDAIAIGTSFSGIFETSDRGASWVSYEDSLKFLYRGAGFYEDIAGLAYSPLVRGEWVIGVGFGGGLYASTPDRRAWTPFAFPERGAGEVIRQVGYRSVKSGVVPWALDVSTDRASWSFSESTQSWERLAAVLPPPPVSAARAARQAIARDRSGIYLSAADASGAALAEKIAFLKKNGLDSVTVDVKDDFGRLTYRSTLPLPNAIGAVHPLFDIKALIKTAHANGIYVVGRMVVFKDEKLYNYADRKYAVWDGKRRAPWANFVRQENADSGQVSYVQREFWVDPCSEEVWRYNIAIAEELERLGIDEIQFDYVRFPSDGPVANAVYRYRRPGMTKVDALESFLSLARSSLTIPISADLYGFSCWYRISNWVGQDLGVLASYIDVVCPMDYPSHFPIDFMKDVPYVDRAGQIYRQGTARAQEIVGNRTLVRPFVQAFLLGGERNMDTAEYSRYLRVELEGARASRSSGFTLWNFGNDYYMVTFPLTPFVPAR